MNFQKGKILLLSLLLVMRAFGHVYNSSKFLELLNAPIPLCMQQRLQMDFKPFFQDGYTLEDVDALYWQVCDNANCYQYSSHRTLRFRIIDNEIYLYVNPKATRTIQDGRPFYTLAALTKILALPNVEFVMAQYDSVHAPFLSPPFFWIPPEMRNANGQNGGDRGPAPLFAIDKADDHLGSGVVLVPDMCMLQESNSRIQDLKQLAIESPWHTKANIAFWRGAPTDILLWENVPNKWSKEFIQTIYKSRPRYRICDLSLKYPHLIDAAFWRSVDCFPGIAELLDPMTKGVSPISAHIRYKYLPCLDGWAATIGFLWRLASNCVTFKQDSPHIQWFYHALKPYEHYIPLNGDVSDLLEKIEWAKRNDAFCYQIMENARSFVFQNLTDEHHLLYLYLVLKQYYELQKFDLNPLKEETRHDPRWQLQRID